MAQNPLHNMSYDDILIDVDNFVEAHGLRRHKDVLRKGAHIAKDPDGFESLLILDEADKIILRNEAEHRWSQPKMLYLLCALCAGCAIVQGMDQTVINGAQEFYFQEFKITNAMMQGLVNGAPYASAAILGCWLNAPLNRLFGRRGTIFISCALAFVTNIWQAAANNTTSLLMSRFVLGVAVGAKSSTTPIYAAESAPTAIRGALTMMWQMWTAFGIMMGFVASLAFQNVDFMGPNTQWRWMIGVTALPPLIVGVFVYCLPESPRWYMDKGRYQDAFESLQRLRKSELQAARDMYTALKFIEVERQIKPGRNPVKELFKVRRNWRAAQSSWFCMLMQQFCGVNVIAYYSTKIFTEAGASRPNALLASFGGGAINWLFALPAIWTIDTFGRRNLLLLTFPMMAACLFWTGANWSIEDDKIRLYSLAASIYIFMAVYSPGLGPVPFTYSAEAFPLHIRALGMASATSVTWAFNFLLSFTWPRMMQALDAQGAFFFYASWNVFGWIFAYFFLPETKGRSLEELDLVFSVRNRDHAHYYAKKLPWYGRKLFKMDVEPIEPLYEVEVPSRPSQEGLANQDAEKNEARPQTTEI